MPAVHHFLHAILLLLLLLSSSGCSSLGLTCYPTGHYLTKQSEEVLDRSPRIADLPRELNSSVVPAHFLQPGDQLLIEPVDLESDVRIPADQQVLIDGSVDLGGYGRVVVTGLTVDIAEDLIERAILDTGNEATDVNVRLLETVDRYYVLGEVNSPGSYPLQGHESVLDGILAAGGLTSSAAPCKILLARPTLPGSCRVTLPVCYREITQMGDTSTNYQLQPGDRIFIASRTWSEELKFWQATKTCSRCCGCQTACPDPSFLQHSNPVSQESASGMPASGVTTEGTSIVPVEVVPIEAAPLGFAPSDTKAISVAEFTPHPAGPSGLATPERLPTTTDGELDFEATFQSGRFKPLWITPAE